MKKHSMVRMKTHIKKIKEECSDITTECIEKYCLEKSVSDEMKNRIIKYFS